MAVVRIEALELLGEAITCVINELDGKVCIGQADPGHELSLPSLVIDPVSWKYFEDNAEQVYDAAPDRVVMNVGRHQGLVQMRLGTETVGQRYELEQRIIDIFLSTPLHPGVILTRVVKCLELGDFTASFELEEDRWLDENVFGGKAWSVLDITATIPALVTRLDSYTIEQLQVGLAGTDDDVVDGDFPPNAEVIQVNTDGTFSAVP